jgi:hypothetical protein
VFSTFSSFSKVLNEGELIPRSILLMNSTESPTVQQVAPESSPSAFLSIEVFSQIFLLSSPQYGIPSDPNYRGVASYKTK